LTLNAIECLEGFDGWSDYKMVLRYAHLASELFSKHANRLNEIVAKSAVVDKVTKLKFCYLLNYLVAMGGIEPPTLGL
jgi:hypothetical protein